MKLSIVIPVYNEEKNLPALLSELNETFRSVADVNLELVFVDDGSQDGSLAYLRSLARQDRRVRVLSFARNFGSHAAIRAGICHSTGDAVAFLCADLQDPPEVLPRMVEKWREGYQVVWGERENRDEKWSQRVFSLTYARLMQKLALPNYPHKGMSVFLIDRQVADVVCRMKEKNTSVFGLILWSGFRQSSVPFRLRQRLHGRSGWTPGKLLKLFADSFVSFSFFPIRLISYLGITVSLLGFLYAFLIAAQWLLYGSVIQGWPTLMVTILTLSGLQLLMLGIVAEYLWRAFDESRQRPPYIIREMINCEAQQEHPATDAPCGKP